MVILDKSTGHGSVVIILLLSDLCSNLFDLFLTTTVQVLGRGSIDPKAKCVDVKTCMPLIKLHDYGHASVFSDNKYLDNSCLLQCNWYKCYDCKNN